MIKSFKGAASTVEENEANWRRRTRAACPFVQKAALTTLSADTMKSSDREWMLAKPFPINLYASHPFYTFQFDPPSSSI